MIKVGERKRKRKYVMNGNTKMYMLRRTGYFYNRVSYSRVRNIILLRLDHVQKPRISIRTDFRLL